MHLVTIWEEVMPAWFNYVSAFADKKAALLERLPVVCLFAAVVPSVLQRISSQISLALADVQFKWSLLWRVSAWLDRGPIPFP